MNSKPKNPVVTIGMPVFNDRRFVREALDSLLAQTFADFELIISDNASSDGTEVVCREYAAKDGRVRYVRQPRNIGNVANFNLLLQEAQGEYFMWAASDDRWDKDFIRTLVEAMRSNPRCISAFGPYVFVDEEGRSVGESRVFDYSGRSTPERMLKLCYYYDDAFVYGLHKRQPIQGVRFPTWWWVNAKNHENAGYPVICYLLAKGDFVLAGTEPLFFNRVYSSEGSAYGGRASRPTYAKDTPLIATYLAFLLRKINVLCVCVRSVYLGNRSIIVVIATLPALTARCVHDCARMTLRYMRSIVDWHITPVLKKLLS